MIASGYTLHLYCDDEPGHTLGGGGYFDSDWKAEFHGELKRECLRDARRCGWKLDLKNGIALCSKHKKK